MIRFSSIPFRSVPFRFVSFREPTNARLGERRRDRFDSIRFGSIRFDSVPPYPRIRTRSIDHEPRVRPVPLDSHRPGARDTIPPRGRDPSSISSRRCARATRMKRMNE